MLAMIEALDDRSLVELDRAIGLTLAPPPTPAGRRLAELGFLASILNQIRARPGVGFAVVERKKYDKIRPAAAPSSAILVRRYGSWYGACYAAYGLQSDGRWTGPGRPWPSSWGLPAMKPYTREEVLAALRQCQLELGRRPSVPVFTRWTREKRRDARARGATIRLPSPSVVYRYWPGARGACLARQRPERVRRRSG
jgi:hypothetical protein